MKLKTSILIVIILFIAIFIMGTISGEETKSENFSYTEIRLDNYKNSLWKWSMAIRRAIKRLEKNGFIPALPMTIHLTEDWEIEKAVIYYRRADGS